MSDNPDPPKGEIIISRDNNLAIRKSGLVKRGLALIHDSRKRHGKILVVDDDSLYIELVSLWLINAGHEVDTALNGGDALKKIRGKSYDLLLTGIHMPGMLGFELYECAIKIAPFLANKTLVITGSIDSADTKNFLAKYGLPGIGKPFTLNQLESEVDAVLNNESKK